MLRPFISSFLSDTLPTSYPVPPPPIQWRPSLFWPPKLPRLATSLSRFLLPHPFLALFPTKFPPLPTFLVHLILSHLCCFSESPSLLPLTRVFLNPFLARRFHCLLSLFLDVRVFFFSIEGRLWYSTCFFFTLLFFSIFLSFRTHCSPHSGFAPQVLFFSFWLWSFCGFFLLFSSVPTLQFAVFAVG